ncbi:MAG: hypothetical protein V4537_07185 [Pseudomonadota bacterium]
MDPLDIPRSRWDASRAESAAVAQRWRTCPDRLALADMFDDLAASSLPIARDRAMTLLGDAGWVRRMLAPLTAALAADPLFEPPLKVSRERGRIGAILFDAPAARVTASVLSARAPAASPATVVLPGHVSLTRYVRAGRAHLRRWRLAGDRLDEIAPLFPGDGDVALHDGRSEGHLVAQAESDVVTLTVILRAGAGPQMREYRIADGAAVRAATTDDAASRTAMLLTLLRVSGRSDAPDVFDAATHDPAPTARWSAMREWLALDAAAALSRLAEMAGSDPDAEVRGVAGETQALVRRKAASCRG